MDTLNNQVTQMKLLRTTNTIPTNTSMHLTSVERVSRGIRQTKDGLDSYGIYFNGGWTNVILDPGDTKLHVGCYIYSNGSGQIALASDIDNALNEIDNF